MIPHATGAISLTFATRNFIRVLAVCLPVFVLLNAAAAENQGQPSGENADNAKLGDIPKPHGPPSDGAKGMPGAMGTIEFKPTDWKGNVTTYWTDTDGVNPGVAGCHLGYDRGVDGGADWSYNGRTFGEACVTGTVVSRYLIESNPGVYVNHPHENDTGHPDVFDCVAWCVGTHQGKDGICVPTKGPAPCAASAKCVCN
jgi:hypothetical protein